MRQCIDGPPTDRVSRRDDEALFKGAQPATAGAQSSSRRPDGSFARRTLVAGRRRTGVRLLEQRHLEHASVRCHHGLERRTAVAVLDDDDLDRIAGRFRSATAAGVAVMRSVVAGNDDREHDGSSPPLVAGALRSRRQFDSASAS